MADNDNPLLQPSTLPHGAPPLDQIKPEHFLPAVKEAVAEARKEIDTIKYVNARATFKNTIEALELSGKKLSRIMSIFSNISSANSSDEIRATEPDVDLECVRYSNDVMMDADLFARVKAVYDMKGSMILSPEQAMLLEHTYKGFVRSGALLSDEDKEELREISEKLSTLSTTFKNNTVKSTKAYQKVIDNEDELKGLPERAKNNYKQAAEESGMPGKWLILLSPPPLDIAEYADNRALREEIYRARTGIAWQDQYDNSGVILEMVRLRHRKAQLMGYGNHAEFVLAERMAKDPKTVMEFLDKNLEVYKPAAEDYVKKVSDFALSRDGIADLKQWDIAYYGRLLQEKTFNLDMESVRPYFDLEKVLDGLRTHAEKLFNIELTETKGKYPVYHSDVKVYEVHDKKTGDMIGLFYADYYARSGAKRPGAWESSFRKRGLNAQGENEFPIVCNTCNFDKPTPEQPTLLSLDEVRTVFHEFGHGLHDLLAKGDYDTLTGTGVKWDFVELPSQLQENWAQQKEVLDTFARHYKTDELLPPDMIQKIRDMTNFDAGYMGLRQTFQAQLDMKWHTTDPDKINNVEELEDGVLASSWLFPREAGPMSTAFSHLFAGGYAAAYYSYKWAEVLEADIFETFAKKGLYDRETADHLRETIYSKGGTVEPDELFRQMAGRDPDPDALFRREGLLPPEKKKDAKAVMDRRPRPPKFH